MTPDRGGIGVMRSGCEDVTGVRVLVLSRLKVYVPDNCGFYRCYGDVIGVKVSQSQ